MPKSENHCSGRPWISKVTSESLSGLCPLCHLCLIPQVPILSPGRVHSCTEPLSQWVSSFRVPLPFPFSSGLSSTGLGGVLADRHPGTIRPWVYGGQPQLQYVGE
jgi:hypothetical protein